MAPEQINGGPITPRTDIYSLGVVLYEAVSGRQFHEQGDNVDWSRIPSDLARVLRRAVAKLPEDRWRDAAAFRRGFERKRPLIPPRVLAFVAAAVLVVVAILVRGVLHPACTFATPGAPVVTLPRIDYAGPPEHAPTADELLRMVRKDLRAHVNFGDSTPRSLIIQAGITVAGEDVRLKVTGGIPASEFHVSLEQWQTLGDSLAYQIVLGIWADRSPLAPSLPVRALPHTYEGLVRFLKAEQLVAEEQWDLAYGAYVDVEKTDSTCWICSWRITEIERWRGHEPDPDRVRRVLLHADSLPLLYRDVIRAAQLPIQPRLDTLRAAAESSREFFLGWFQLGDELFHRGPLVGRRRAEAIAPLERAARLRPDFGPAGGHRARPNAGSKPDQRSSSLRSGGADTRRAGARPSRGFPKLRRPAQCRSARSGRRSVHRAAASGARGTRFRQCVRGRCPRGIASLGCRRRSRAAAARPRVVDERAARSAGYHAPGCALRAAAPPLRRFTGGGWASARRAPAAR